MKQLFNVMLIGAIMVMIGCQKEVDVPITPESSTTANHVLTSRAVNSYNVSLTNFRYVWQNRRPSSWTDDTKYGGKGYQCSYPQYNGSYTFTEGGNTNLCGLTSYMMGVHIVSHPALFDVPYSTNDRAIRLVEYAKRYKTFDGTYAFGNYTSLYTIGTMGNGLSSKKGDLTDWSKCTTYTGSGTSWGGTTNSTIARDFMKNKIEFLTLY
ncbi:MAG TPA: hypothetical protein PLW93_04715, partial [Candidatus Absconditabacterales bacterium]|nr:hypothetical protein [Candidatus Absconditabacterales bacterium]